MADFLLELLSEEIPARMQDKARADLARLFEEQLGEAGLEGRGDRDLRDAAPARADRARPARPRPRRSARSSRARAPRAPPQALEGFLRKTGLTQDQLDERDGVWFATIEQARPRHRRRARRGDPRHRPRLSLAQVDALGRGLGLDREPALGAPAAGHRRLARRGGRRVRDRRRADRARPRSATASTIPARSPSAARSDYVEKLRACHVIVDQEERKAIIRKEADEAAAQHEDDPRRGPGRRKCRPHRMAGAAAGQLRRGLPRAAARADPAHHAGEPEIFRLPGRGRQAFEPLRLRRQYRRQRSRRGGRRQREGARRAPRRTRNSSGSRTSRSRSTSRRRSSTRSSSTKSSAPSPTRSSGSRSSPQWLVQERLVKGADARRRSDRRAARQGRSRHRDGRRVPRAAGRDRRLLCPRPGPAATRSPTRSAIITSRRGRATRCRPIRSRSRSTSPTSSIRSSPSSRSARSRPARAIRSRCAAPRSASCRS